MTKPVIVTRATKGSALTWTEGDSNFTNLQNATITIGGDGGTPTAIDLNGSVTIAGGTGLTTSASSGTLTVDLDNTAVTAGSYTKANITVDAQGRITSATDGTDTVTSVNSQTGAVSLDTDDISEGTTNQYFTTQRARDSFSASTGITITSGAIATTITQYTDSAARSAISVTDSGGEGSLSYDSGTGVITYTGPSFSGLEVTSAKGQANGYASLDSNGLVPSSQLPSYVDDVVEYADYASLPGTGETGKIYVAQDNGKIYRWSGSAYVEISPSPGSTDSVTEGSTNLYFTNSRARSAISVTDSGGDGSLSYDSGTGVITYVGPSATDVRAHFSGGTAISITSGVIAFTGTQATGNELENIVEDTTPQLGGALDAQGYVISNPVLKDYAETVYNIGSSDSPTITISNGNVQTVTISSGLALPAFSDAAAGQSVTLLVTGSGTASGTGAYIFAGGNKTLTTKSVVSIFYDGTTYWASIATGFVA